MKGRKNQRDERFLERDILVVKTNPVSASVIIFGITNSDGNIDIFKGLTKNFFGFLIDFLNLIFKFTLVFFFVFLLGLGRIAESNLIYLKTSTVFTTVLTSKRFTLIALRLSRILKQAAVIIGAFGKCFPCLYRIASIVVCLPPRRHCPLGVNIFAAISINAGNVCWRGRDRRT